MGMLVLGLIVFLGVHSVRIFAEDWRTRGIARWGEVGWKGLYSALSLIGFALIVWGFAQARLHHPMILGVKLWAFGHLLATGTLADLVLFGAFLLWAVLDCRAARRRDRALGTVYAPGTMGPTAIAVLVGVVAWAAFAFWLHAAWIGVAPFPRA